MFLWLYFLCHLYFPFVVVQVLDQWSQTAPQLSFSNQFVKVICILLCRQPSRMAASDLEFCYSDPSVISSSAWAGPSELLPKIVYSKSDEIALLWLDYKRPRLPFYRYSLLYACSDWGGHSAWNKVASSQQSIRN